MIEIFNCEKCRKRFYCQKEKIDHEKDCNGTGKDYIKKQYKNVTLVEPKKFAPDIDVTTKQSISDDVEKRNETIAGEFIKSYGMYDMRLDYRKDIDKFVLKSASMPYEAEENYNRKYSIFKKGILYGQQKSQGEIEELTESLGTYYDLNTKLEQQIEKLKSNLKKVSDGTTHIVNNRDNKIRKQQTEIESLEGQLNCLNGSNEQYKKQIKDMEYKEKYH